MSTEPSTTPHTRNRFVWLGAASFLVAGALVGLAVWSGSGSPGYPAAVAGIFGVIFLGVAFPALDRAVRGFLGLWMLAGGWMFITTAPIALFQALSRWMLERQPPLTLQVAVLVLWGVLLTGAISLIATEGSRVRLYAALSRIGALAPLVYTFNVLCIAMVFFALATCLLTGADPSVLTIPNSDAASQTKLSDPQERYSFLLDFYLWHILEEVPLLSVNKTLHWNEPLEYRGWVGPVLLLFKVAVIVPAITAFAFYAGRRRADPAPETT
jgi:hypothetical protein